MKFVSLLLDRWVPSNDFKDQKTHNQKTKKDKKTHASCDLSIYNTKRFNL